MLYEDELLSFAIHEREDKHFMPHFVEDRYHEYFELIIMNTTVADEAAYWCSLDKVENKLSVPTEETIYSARTRLSVGELLLT